MNAREEFLKKIIATFRIEASEGIQKITSCILDLEKNPDSGQTTGIIESAFREVHSLKGASRAVNNAEIESICQSLEAVFSQLKNKLIILKPHYFNVFHDAVNVMTEILEQLPEPINQPIKDHTSQIILKLTNIETAEEALPVVHEKKHHEKEAREHPPSEDATIRISTRKLDNLLLKVEELISVKLNNTHFLHEISQIITSLDTQNPMDDIQWKLLKENLKKLRKIHQSNLHESGVKIDGLHNDVQQVMSVPFSTIMDVYPKTVRDLSHNLGKEIELKISGKQIEIDRRIIEEIRVPLMHLIRNSIDHGVEKPDVRVSLKKPAKALLEINILRLENNKVEITVSDDGKGLDFEKLRGLYLKQNPRVEESGHAVTDSELVDYIFQSGISTNEIITDLSGLGLGLAIVKEKIEQLGGIIQVSSQAGKGTTFQIQIPLTMESFRCIRLRSGQQEFVIPTHKVERVIRGPVSDLKTLENKTCIVHEGIVIPVSRLSDLLRIPDKPELDENIIVLVIGMSHFQAGILVNDILDEEEILVKRFNKHIKHIRHFSSVAVTGSGKMVPVLHTADLLKTLQSGGYQEMSQSLKKDAREAKSVLVVEDSITSRMLLKNILESSGYEVSTAVDGMDGFMKVREGNFKLVVSDVDMPNMNGFDLTVKIRSTKEIQDIPIVLVTSLSNQEDREHGMDAGANAYLVKSSFDQSNLLEIIDRLILDA